jgi:hypothetical protein
VCAELEIEDEGKRSGEEAPRRSKNSMQQRRVQEGPRGLV